VAALKESLATIYKAYGNIEVFVDFVWNEVDTPNERKKATMFQAYKDQGFDCKALGQWFFIGGARPPRGASVNFQGARSLTWPTTWKV